MEKALLVLIFAVCGISLSAQVVIYQEDFEPPSLDDLVTSTINNDGTPHWGVTSSLATSGTNTDSCRVSTMTTAYLTTNFFNTLGYSEAILEFNHICKINFFDIAEVEATGDSGQTWTKLNSTHYWGAGNFATNGNSFSAVSYGNLWLPGNDNAVPQNSWWKTETFDVSPICGSSPYAAIRFKLTDGGPPGGQNNYGWLIDDIKITIDMITQTPDLGISEVDAFSLGQNFPNPSLGKTIIPFNIPAYGEYRFSLVNRLGQEVLSIRDKGISGQQQIELDTRVLASGLYFYFIEYENHRLVRKMILE